MFRVPKAPSNYCCARQSRATYIQSLENITSPESVPGSCVHQHTWEIPAQRVHPSDIKMQIYNSSLDKLLPKALHFGPYLK